jgi:galactose mutarotase-like enzyme
MVELKNKVLTVKLKEKGAELQSIVLNKDNIEYLWQGDDKIWGRRAPILFPIVGKMLNDEYKINNNKYKMTQHGFARDCEFKIDKFDESSVTLTLENNKETLEKYPYKFELVVKYAIKENEIVIEYLVKNKDSVQMNFSIGAHPGFNCPLAQGETMEDYYLEFSEKETLDTYILSAGLIGAEKSRIIENSKVIELNKALFKRDALIFEGYKSESVAMRSKITGKAVKLEFAGFPYLGIWSKPEGADFICIEPWYGIADSIDSNQVFSSKKGIIKLEADETFSCSFKILIE